jgi:hypothetical protein
MSKTPELTTSEVIKMVDFGLGEAWDALDEPQKKELKNKFFLLNRYISVAGNPKRGSNPTTEDSTLYCLLMNASISTGIHCKKIIRSYYGYYYALAVIIKRINSSTSGLDTSLKKIT